MFEWAIEEIVAAHPGLYLEHCAVRCALEVSGTEDPRMLTRRERTKVTQVLQNPLQWNGHVFICCFAPAHRLIRWSYHTQRARTHEPF